MYKLNYEEDRITAKGSFESNEELWKQKIKQVKVSAEHINPFIVNVSLDNKSYDEIFYEDGNVRLEIDGSVLEINDGKITFSGYADDLKDMAEYLNEVEELLLPENREALHQIESAQKNARKR